MRTVKKYQELFPNLDGPAVIASPENVCYVTGFYTTARRPGQIGPVYAVMWESGTALLCPDNWRTEAERQILEEMRKETGPGTGTRPAALEITVISYGSSKEDRLRTLYDSLKSCGCFSQIGVEEESMEASACLSVTERFPEAEIRSITQELRDARLIKSESEIQALRSSASLAVRAMECAKSLVRPGIREYEMAAELECFMRKNRSDGTPFTLKALSGENTAVTIRIPGERKVCRGDLVLFDFGAIVDHYASDWTRTFVCGEATPEQQELYELVWRIERECIRLIKPGVTIRSLMERALLIAGSHRLGKWFNPYLGHSIGLSSQEWPALNRLADGVLLENMVITIEPGIYIPGAGGVRIEDEVLVTDKGFEVLTGLENEEFELNGMEGIG